MSAETWDNVSEYNKMDYVLSYKRRVMWGNQDLINKLNEALSGQKSDSSDEGDEFPESGS